MSEALSITPARLRGKVRSGSWTTGTTGTCPGYMQANLVILPVQWSEDFHELCQKNPQALPLLEMTRAGVPDQLVTAPGADLRTDLPRYHVHRDGMFSLEVADLGELWRDDLVGFLLGCSFSAERLLQAAGVRLRHHELRQSVPMFITSVECESAGRLHGPLVVSMRPIAKDEVESATRATGRLPLAHGAPIHVGNPRAIGIDDLSRPEWGDPIELEPDEVPVFWACGVTPQTVIRAARPDFAVTHAPGHMFVTDVPDHAVEGRHELDASVLAEAPG